MGCGGSDHGVIGYAENGEGYNEANRNEDGGFNKSPQSSPYGFHVLHEISRLFHWSPPKKAGKMGKCLREDYNMLKPYEKQIVNMNIDGFVKTIIPDGFGKAPDSRRANPEE